MGRRRADRGRAKGWENTHTGDLMCHKINNRTVHRVSVHKYMVVSI